MLVLQIIGPVSSVLLSPLVGFLLKEIGTVYSQRGEKHNELVDLVEKLNEYINFPNVAAFIREVDACHFDDKIDKKCSCGHLPNCCTRCLTGKQIRDKLSEGEKLLRSIKRNKGCHPSGTSQLLPQSMGDQVAELVHMIWISLPEKNVICIHGESGVGKTRIAAEIFKKARMESQQINNPSRCFNHVFWVDVARTSNSIPSLQQTIAKKANIELPEYTVDTDVREHTDVTRRRADTLLKALTNMGRYLLILDNVRMELSFEEIGIPKPTVKNGCKIIITARSDTVYRRADVVFPIKLLADDDAQALFMHEVGFVTRETKADAKKVALACSRLPLAIVVVARSLRYQIDSTIWRRTLTDLENSKSTGGGIIVIDQLKNILNGLNDPKARLCLLYCALYPEGYHFDTKELIECWMWEGLLLDEERIDVQGWIEKQMEQGQDIVQTLENAGLVDARQEGGEELIVMPQLIRDTAVHITKTKPCFLIRAGDAEMQPTDKWPKDVERVSLMRNGLKGLPSKPKFNKLHSLLLQHNSSLNYELSNDFFNEMPLLRVLNLSNTGVPSLPDLSKLENLLALFVSNCRQLKSLPSLEKLGKLMVLDLSYTGITNLPDGLKMLTSLRRLNLSYSELKNFQSGLLLAFERLEELLMYGCHFSWEEARTKELENCGHLFILEANFRNGNAFNEYVNSKHWYVLKAFKFSVGGICTGAMGPYSISVGNNFIVNGSPVSLPEHTTDLHVIRCEDVIDQLPIKRSFENLKALDISNCGNLQFLFNRGVLRELPKLEKIAIRYCKSLERVIQDETSNEIKDANPVILRIQTLILVGLPQLASIYDGEVVWNSLQTIEIFTCSNLNRIPSPPEALETIRCQKTWFSSLDHNLQNSLKNKFEEAMEPKELSRSTSSTSSSSGTAGKEIMEEKSANKGKAIAKDTVLEYNATRRRSSNTGIAIREPSHNVPKDIATSQHSGNMGNVRANRTETCKCTVTEDIATNQHKGNTGIAAREPSDNGNVRANQLEPSKCTGIVKLNIDGSSKGNPGKGGFGGIFRDKTDDWICGYTGKLEKCECLEAQLLGIHRGLLIISENEMKDIEIESDSQDAVNLLIKDGAGQNSPYRTLIDESRLLLQKYNCSIKHILKANQCANALANKGLEQEEQLLIHEDPPPYLRRLLAADRA